ncbi:hypothetical protein H0H92_001931 [Tricholoma furcatifolium]|nr:hypothetical protein H0H92_001931 [Tricholoma furcatifolium]
MPEPSSIIAGLVFHENEGSRWISENFNVQLAGYVLGANIRLKLQPLLSKEGIDAYGICRAPRRLESDVSDFLIVTQIDSLPFTHNGHKANEEVDDEALKPIKGVKEDNVKAQLLAKFGITTCGFKCYYSDADRFRARVSIIAGLVIHKNEGRRWLSEKYTNVQLADYVLDANVKLRLETLLVLSEEGIDVYDICNAPRRLESNLYDILIVTQIERAPFNDGHEPYDEVDDEGLKPVEGVKEAKVKAQLLEKFGMYRNRVHKSLPIENFQESRHVDSNATTPIGSGDTSIVCSDA